MNDLTNKINLRFTSGNSVPVDSVRITREEWGALIAERHATLDREQVLEDQIKRLDSELQNKALTDEGVLADAYWNCADMITPWLGEQTGPDTLINSVSGSLEFLIEQWREKKTLEQERDAALEREQALASLLLQYRDAHIDLTNAEVCDDGWNRLLTPMMLSRLDTIANHSPGYSLARRDLIKQAEALEYAAANVVKWTECETLRGHAKDLRQRAQALK